MAQITIGPTIAVSSFNFYGFQNPSFTAKYIAPQDINGDGIDEVFFYGFETQPNTPQNYSNTSVHVFGWEEGSFKDLTSQWLPYGSNQVEAVGDVSFGDFNGDGLLDVFLSAYADMDYTCNAYQLINKGSYFEKISLGPTSALQHGVASADINRDGFADVYSSGYGSAPQIYLGSANGLQAANFASGTFSGGSGIALGDFLGDGTVSAVFVDHVASQGKDTALYEIVANRDHTFSLDYVSSLPSARLDLPLYGPLPSEWGHSHDIRARGLDFSGDGLLDLLVFSRMNFDSSTGTWPEVSEIQFLENMGEGSFVDVTDQIRIGYNTSTNVTYNPIIRDINGDGLVDIFTDDATFSSTHDSAAILLHQSNGTFVDTARESLSAILSGNGGMGNVAQGPNQNWYLVSFSRNSQTTLEDVSLTLISTPEHPVGRVNGDELLLGDGSINYIFGFSGNDKLSGLANDDVLDGGAGWDTAVFSGQYSQYQVSQNNGNQIVTDTVSNRDGVDTLSNIERLHFSDTNVAFDTNVWDNAGSAYRLYKAAFDREPDETGLGYWIDVLDDGGSLQLAASGFIHSAEFQSLYGANPSDTLFITKLYNNVLDRDPDQGGLDYWIGQLNNGMSRESALINFSESNENVSNVAALIENGIQYQPWLL